jgi:hypothetical protein
MVSNQATAEFNDYLTQMMTSLSLYKIILYKFHWCEICSCKLPGEINSRVVKKVPSFLTWWNKFHNCEIDPWCMKIMNCVPHQWNLYNIIFLWNMFYQNLYHKKLFLGEFFHRNLFWLTETHVSCAAVC